MLSSDRIIESRLTEVSAAPIVGCERERELHEAPFFIAGDIPYTGASLR
jgi:hypothetical protein